MAKDKPSAGQSLQQTTSKTSQTTFKTGQTSLSLQLDEDEAMSDEDLFKDAEEGVVSMEPHPPAPPPSHHMTTAMGLNTHRIQVMKASFFGAGESERVKGGGWEVGRGSGRHVQVPLAGSKLGIAGRLLAGTSTVSQLPQSRVGMEQRLGRVQFRDTPSPIPYLPPDSIPSLSSHLLRHPTPLPTPTHSLLEFAGEDSMQTSTLAGDSSTSFLSRRSRRSHHPPPPVGLMQVHSSVLTTRRDLNTLVPPSESMVCGRSRMAADAGLFLGRSFRVGWGPNWTLSHSGSEIHSGSGMGPGSSACSIQVVVERLFPTPFMINAPPQIISVSSLEKFINSQVLHFAASFLYSHFLSPTWLPSWNTVKLSLIPILLFPGASPARAQLYSVPLTPSLVTSQPVVMETCSHRGRCSCSGVSPSRSGQSSTELMRVSRGSRAHLWQCYPSSH